MGSRTAYRSRFFAEHPRCCFCGGAAIATTIDHVPSRAVFDGPVWPEGYDFPACDACNAVTANAELLVALISKMHAHIEEGQLDRLMSGVRNNFPEVYRSFLQLGAAQKKRIVKEHGLELRRALSLVRLP
jgi:hypothetical protein